jgi:hypothetical protein
MDGSVSPVTGSKSKRFRGLAQALWRVIFINSFFVKKPLKRA